MKKITSTLLVLMVMLSLAVSPALALDGLLSLVETRNDYGGGVIFVLEFSGEFPDGYFTGFVTEGDNRYPIHCNVVSENVVQCTVSRATAGKNVVLHVGEFIFWTFVPETPAPKETSSAAPSLLCYNVYDINEGQDGLIWFAFDVHCPAETPSPGALLNDFPGPFFGTSDYYFDDQSPLFCIRDSVNEPAYYVECNFD